MTTNIVSRFEILVISLETDLERRNLLRERFRRYSTHFKLIKGIDMRDATQPISHTVPPPCPRLTRKPLKPSEIGCALSHMLALKQAAISNARTILILEDDVLGKDEDIDTVHRISEQLPPHHFLLCGGQEGLRGNKFLYGSEEFVCFRLPSMVRRFVTRACCYALSPSMAVAILERQQACLHRSDDWHTLLRHEHNVFFSNLLGHPMDLSASHIEIERTQLPQRGSWKRIWADGIGYTITTQISKISLPLLGYINRWRKIDLQRK